MKKHLVIVLALFAFVGHAFAVGTEGQEFWVALNITTGTGGDTHEPFICITTQYQGGHYTITNPNNPSVNVSGAIPTSGYVKIDINQLPLNTWYPVGQTAQSMSCKKGNYGLKVTTTVDCSVFCGNRLPQSFDAANILPIDAIQMDYITQDYPGFDHEDEKGGGYPVVTILATHNNTKVDIQPASKILNAPGTGTAPFSVTLNAGEVYYLTGERFATLSGTTIHSNQKIAVFSGVNNTDIPGPLSARDHLYEQNMPVDYWGTQFVVTRTMMKDANRIRVTAQENGTSIFIDGRMRATIDAGETYEFELCSDVMRTEEGYTKAEADGRGTALYFTDYAHYLETSCPCAVYSYDVSEKYIIKKNGTSEVDPTAQGDPAMVWISPLEQKISKITFGVMNTDKTPTHYVNIITLTTEVPNIELKEIITNGGQVIYGNNMLTPADFSPVRGNPTYSYARKKLTYNSNSVYTITSKAGFIAHVYGSGDKESYAYSCGSAAVKRGINVDGMTFIDGAMGDDHFCINTPLLFDAQVGADIIDKVDWDFGDGITEYNGTPQTTHEYETKGWYDVIANVYAHKNCPATVYPAQAVHFSFYVDKAEIIKHETSICVPWDDPTPTDTITKTDYYDCDSIVITSTFVRRMSKPTDIEITAKDSFLLNGEWLYESCQRSHTFMNSQECDSVVNYDVTIVHCLDIEVPQDVNPECDGGTSVLIDFNKVKGDIASATFFKLDGTLETPFPMTISADGHSFVLDVSTFNPGTVAGRIEVYDEICDQTLKFPITIFVRLPNTILHQKYDNVVGVALDAIQLYGIQGYQWHLDGELKQGQSTSIYYQDNSFTSGQYIEVEVLLPNGKWIKSCRLNLTGAESMTNPFRQEGAEAQKVVRRGHIYILQEDGLYNTLGEKVE